MKKAASDEAAFFFILNKAASDETQPSFISKKRLPMM
jgi:hypothetical protein